MNRTTLSRAFQVPAFLTGVVGLRSGGNIRPWILGMIAVVTVVSIACGTGDSAASSADDPDGQNPTATSGAVLSPTGEASDFEVSSPNNGVFNLERLEGQPVLLNFWFPSCPPCRAELPDLQTAYEKHGEDIQFIGVQLLGLDSAEEGQEFLDELGITYPSGADPESQMVRDYKVVGFPTTIFIDRDHNVVKKHAGILTEDSIEELITATIASGTAQNISGS
ncbi:MAG: TlpA family protein disulfide reductase [Chloroflexi bacterium]|nr:TlpA family protein disulfide reductase [Chloroflexota bacterium]MBT4072741.1 TlpA family protein disulfide reductase [Chloroflexota bacterium]MBT5319880.1 TlpA family protein disulfide reductase [Chloroflexota bacterium]MBT6682377.1 TlpA family protein disulfide reductase [Chloroflexota bacterium]